MWTGSAPSFYPTNMLQNKEVEQLRRFRVLDILEYVPFSITVKTILSNPFGKIVAYSFDGARDQPENTSTSDTILQIIDGNAEILVDSQLHSLAAGDFILIPANARSKITANQRFKMVSTTIKSDLR